jgi:protein subunit release factor A
MIPTERLEQLIEKAAVLEAQMADPALKGEEFAALSREYADLSTVAAKAKELQAVRREFQDLEIMSGDLSADAEMRDLAHE